LKSEMLVWNFAAVNYSYFPNWAINN
jgi:hypothetical protein